jgi:hypothetical protein
LFSKTIFVLFIIIFRDGNIGGAWLWSGEVLVGHGPAFEVKFLRYFSYFLYLIAILPTISVTKSGLTTDIQHVVSQV